MDHPAQPAPSPPTAVGLPAARLSSFGPALRVAVFGAGGGIGAEFVRQLAATPHVERVFAASRRPAATHGERVEAMTYDLSSEASIATTAERMGADGPIHLCLIATGMLQDETRNIRPERSWRALDGAALAQVFAVNTIGPALIAKHMLALCPREGKSVLAALSARVGSIGDNALGGWHAYRASKAALNQIIRTLAIELARKRAEAICVGLHPGTVDTGLSKPFQGNVPSPKLFSPQTSVAHMLRVIDGLRPGDSGGCFAWDGAPIPP